MNDEFIKNAQNYGEEGKEWLEKIPSIIKQSEEKWSIKVSPPFNLNYNYVAPALRQDGSKVVLKIGFPKDREFQTEIESLSIFNGEGIEKLLEKDLKNSVILIERLTPGIPLSSLENDDEATMILIRVMKRLWKPLPQNHTLISITEHTKALGEYKEKLKGRGPIHSYLIDKADTLIKELIKTSSPPVLTHGDLHHDNILSSQRDEWLAIDPKGVAAEREYDTSSMIRNPYEKMRNLPNPAKLLKRRIELMSDQLNFDPKRVWMWCFSQTVLSGVWNIETGKGPDHAIQVAKALDSLSFLS